MKKFLCMTFTLIFAFLLGTQAFAASISYSHQFGSYSSTSSIATARSPFHLGNTDSGGDDFSNSVHRINGPNNQPRHLSSDDLHNGTDIQSTSSYYVYPMFRCKVISVVNPGTINNGYVIVQYDIDGNGTWDNYYAKYMHIMPSAGLVAGTTIRATTEKLGQVDIQRGGTSGWTPHLHLQDTDSSGSYSTSLFRYFRSVQNWGYGPICDYLNVN